MNLFMHMPQSARETATLTVDAAVPSPQRISPFLLGKFCEHLGQNILNGMEAQILRNPTFARWRFGAGDNRTDGGVREECDADVIGRRIEALAQRENWPDAAPVRDAYFDGAAFGWFRVGAAGSVRLSPDVGPHGGRAQRIEAMAPAATETTDLAAAPPAVGIAQWTYLPLHRTRGFEFRLVGRAVESCRMTLGIAPAQGGEDMVSIPLALREEWQTFHGRITLPQDAPDEALYQFRLTTEAPANIVLDRVLLYPDDHVGGADPDVIRMLRQAKLPLLRWPGGNFVSGYRWRHGVGPVDARPTVFNPAWEGVEPNLFGTDEFIAFCRAVGCEPMICVNAGDGTPEEAAAWIEYCNGAADTPMGRLRAENGHAQPYGVRYWEVGNEIYGRWQVSWSTAGGYPDRYARFSRAMRGADPSIRLLACGQGRSATCEWNRRLVESAGPDLEVLADHILTGGQVNADTDGAELTGAFLGYATVLEARYGALRDFMRAHGVCEPRVAITELQMFAHFTGDEKPDGKLTADTTPRPDTLAEALYFATLFNLAARSGGFIEMITHSATVNHGGGLRKQRERVFANPVHHAHAMAATLAGGAPVPVRLECAAYSTASRFGDIPPLENVPVLDAMAVVTPRGDLALLIAHRGLADGPVELTIAAEAFRAKTKVEVTTLGGGRWHDRNTLCEPDRIQPRTFAASLGAQGRLGISLQPCSLTLVIFNKD